MKILKSLTIIGLAISQTIISCSSKINMAQASVPKFKTTVNPNLFVDNVPPETVLTHSIKDIGFIRTKYIFETKK